MAPHKEEPSPIDWPQQYQEEPPPKSYDFSSLLNKFKSQVEDSNQLLQSISKVDDILNRKEEESVSGQL
jgi:hypothetical protein